MRILLCSATTLEIQPIIDHLNQNKIKDVEVLITGVGLTATTYSVTKKLLSIRPDLIIQAGFAGSFDESIQPGDAVVIQTEAFGDLGVVENEEFKTMFDLGLTDKNEKPWTNGALVNKSATVLFATGLRLINGVTVQEITTGRDRINYYKGSISAQVETMEGAALHYVALMEDIPFLQLRSISNFVGERNKKNWELQKAISALNKELQEIITKLLNDEINTRLFAMPQ